MPPRRVSDYLFIRFRRAVDAVEPNYSTPYQQRSIKSVIILASFGFPYLSESRIYRISQIKTLGAAFVRKYELRLRLRFDIYLPAKRKTQNCLFSDAVRFCTVLPDGFLRSFRFLRSS